jgi:hypothetical protein
MKHYDGEMLLLIGSDSVEGGEDSGEYVFSKPEVLDIFKNPF